MLQQQCHLLENILTSVSHRRHKTQNDLLYTPGSQNSSSKQSLAHSQLLRKWVQPTIREHLSTMAHT